MLHSLFPGYSLYVQLPIEVPPIPATQSSISAVVNKNTSVRQSQQSSHQANVNNISKQPSNLQPNPQSHTLTENHKLVSNLLPQEHSAPITKTLKPIVYRPCNLIPDKRPDGRPWPEAAYLSAPKLTNFSDVASPSFSKVWIEGDGHVTLGDKVTVTVQLYDGQGRMLHTGGDIVSTTVVLLPTLV